MNKYKSSYKTIIQTMKKHFTFFAMMGFVLATAFAQDITLKFTGATSSGTYVHMDSVRVQNMSRSWTETLVYPDTVLTFQQTGISEARNYEAELSAYPNPNNGQTTVAVSVAQSGDAILQLYDLAGKQLAERAITLVHGQNLFGVRLQKAQVYLFVVTTAQGRSTIKLLNRGEGTGNSISFLGSSKVVEKRQSTNPFQSGDVLKVTGFSVNPSDGQMIASQYVQQQQMASENFTLIFGMALFSVSANTRVIFSPGNLQWSATGGGSTDTTHIVAGGGTAAGMWRFSPNQWDTIGAANRNISSSYNGWIDLFGWGTSGFNNKYPYMTSLTNSDYGNGASNIAGTNYDWGVYNSIYNPRIQATDAPGTWRALTNIEWAYLINTRRTTSGIRYAKASVCGVSGLILVPDNWSTSTYTLNSTNTANSAYTANVISEGQWGTLERAGCVFLPAAGGRYWNEVSTVGALGYYWSSTYYVSNYVFYLDFSAINIDPTAGTYCYYGTSVRLVRTAQ